MTFVDDNRASSNDAEHAWQVGQRFAKTIWGYKILLGKLDHLAQHLGLGMVLS